MKSTLVIAAITALVHGFAPNTGPECKLTCRNRVTIEECPKIHYVDNDIVACARTQYGCLDKRGNWCGVNIKRNPLCVVDGPCAAGPLGCREDKTGADDGLPAGTYVGHCPKPRPQPTLKELCGKCQKDCESRAGKSLIGGLAWQRCLRRGCGTICDRENGRWPAASKYCVSAREAAEVGNPAYQQCMLEVLGAFMPESRRCHLQYKESEQYCNALGYISGDARYQQCINSALTGICPRALRCERQLETARVFCQGNTTAEEGSPESQACINNALKEVCPDVGCRERFYWTDGYCEARDGDDSGLGGPDYQKCIIDSLGDGCPKDIECQTRYEKASNYCNQTMGLDMESEAQQKCVVKTLGDGCPASTYCPSCQSVADNHCLRNYRSSLERTAECLHNCCKHTCPADTKPGNHLITESMQESLHQFELRDLEGF